MLSAHSPLADSSAGSCRQNFLFCFDKSWGADKKEPMFYVCLHSLVVKSWNPESIEKQGWTPLPWSLGLLCLLWVTGKGWSDLCRSPFPSTMIKFWYKSSELGWDPSVWALIWGSVCSHPCVATTTRVSGAAYLIFFYNSFSPCSSQTECWTQIWCKKLCAHLFDTFVLPSLSNFF